ncbi:MAG: A/G-specific adenine glycosylase, partial [Actinomycetota bacterium]|nr:A/G-specific adenine glycosylase [Actinomycetota bacterium]
AALCAWRAAGYPADEHTGRRRTQSWQGTDRQVRGQVMALLREAAGPVPLEVVEQIEAPRDQLARCLGSLLADGLAVLDESVDPPLVALPVR